jgi:Tfp pilus assembly protein PilV
MTRSRQLVHRAFVLLEAMLAVAIFALGVLALGKCVTNCLDAERFKSEAALVRRALENRFAELESGAQPLRNGQELLPAPFTGITLTQQCVPLRKTNERNVEMTGLYAVTLDASWQSGRGIQSRQLAFYVHPRNP